MLVDDDNVLEPDYLDRVGAIFAAYPRLGAAGGPVVPDYERPAPPWLAEFESLLALRNLGPQPIIAESLRPSGEGLDAYPPCAPIGAGMALRRQAWAAWLDAPPGATPTDRRGTSLASGGDNDIVVRALRAGWAVGYFPELRLTHLIPASRMQAGYLARLNRAIQQSWMQVLAAHGISPWPPLSRTGARLRKARAWLVHQPWRSPAARIRWAGACGHFDGRVPH